MSSMRFPAPAAAGVLALCAAPAWPITPEQAEAGRADYSQHRATMPPEGPGALPEETYVNVIAYLLAQNGAAERAEPLAASSALIGTLLPSGGPSPAREAPEPEPTGVIVAGTVPDFAPLTDELLRNPPPGDWPMLRRDYAASS